MTSRFCRAKLPTSIAWRSRETAGKYNFDSFEFRKPRRDTLPQEPNPLQPKPNVFHQRFVAVGCTDGIIRVFNASSGNLAYTLSSASTLQLPITSICFRPPLAASQNRTGVLIAASADGTITHWHMSSQTRVFQIREEEENQVYAADYACDGATFCAAGQDAKVRLYDEPTKMLVATLQSGKSAVSLNAPD